MDKQKAYLKYKGDFEKSSLFSIILWTITLVGVLALIFLPVFQIKLEFEGTTLATEEFSMLDELRYNIEGLKSSSAELASVGYLMMLFPIFTMMMGAILLIIGIKNLFEEITGRNEDAYMIKYSQIKKSGGEKEKKKFFRQQTMYSFFMMFIFSVVYAKILGALFSKIGESVDIYSYLMDVNGISVWGILGIILFVGYIVVHVLKSKKDKEIMLKITKEEFETENVSEETTEETL